MHNPSLASLTKEGGVFRTMSAVETVLHLFFLLSFL